tara:strand:+ start:765 stop:959 length:195 start_codon:yes stop_codon:yes gene_type:complete
MSIFSFLLGIVLGLITRDIIRNYKKWNKKKLQNKICATKEMIKDAMKELALEDSWKQPKGKRKR